MATRSLRSADCGTIAARGCTAATNSRVAASPTASRARSTCKPARRGDSGACGTQCYPHQQLDAQMQPVPPSSPCSAREHDVPGTHHDQALAGQRARELDGQMASKSARRACDVYSARNRGTHCGSSVTSQEKPLGLPAASQALGGFAILLALAGGPRPAAVGPSPRTERCGRLHDSSFAVGCTSAPSHRGQLVCSQLRYSSSELVPPAPCGSHHRV
jgi:hypothetical protein